MGITAHVNYSNKALQAWKVGSLLPSRLSNDYQFGDYKTVVISSITTEPLNDYARTGTNRYGIPTDVEDTTQELTVTQDKGFTKVIDEGDVKDQQYLKKAGRVVALIMKEQVIPMTDTRGFEVLAAKAGKTGDDTSELTKENVVDRIATGTAYMDDKEVPSDGRTLFITSVGYKTLRLSDQFMGNEALGKKALAAGSMGEFDGMEVVKVPSSRFPAGVNFMIVHRSAACMPMKIKKTKIHQDPPGINGNLMEGRQYYDCFVFDKLKHGIYVDKTTA